MTSDLDTHVVRRSLRTLLVASAGLLPWAAAPAVAAPPEAWPDAEPVGALDFLLVLVVIPLGVALVITVLAYVPSMVRGERYTPGLAWRNESQWFGGPKDGLETIDKAETAPAEADRGGSSARW